MTSAHIPYGLREDGRMVSVSEVPRGRQCGCRCPACGSPLEARKGDVREHYFAHQPGEIDCQTGFETALHLMAKQLIADSGGLVVPELTISEEATDISGKKHVERETIATGEWQSLERVALELQLDGLRPDVVGYAGEQTYVVEIAVTHPCSPEKRQWLQDRGYFAFEIDLSEVSLNTSLEELKDIVLMSPRNKQWLSFPPEKVARDALKARLAVKLEAANAAIRTQRAVDPKKLSRTEAALRSAHNNYRYTSPRFRKYDPRWFFCESCRHIWSMPLTKAPYSLYTVPCPECGYEASCAPYAGLKLIN